MFKSSLGVENTVRETRTMEVHHSEYGWYFTVHQGEELLYSSAVNKDRGRITTDGIAYLDKLNRLDHQKGQSNGS